VPVVRARSRRRPTTRLTSEDVSVTAVSTEVRLQ